MSVPMSTWPAATACTSGGPNGKTAHLTLYEAPLSAPESLTSEMIPDSCWPTTSVGLEALEAVVVATPTPAAAATAAPAAIQVLFIVLSSLDGWSSRCCREPELAEQRRSDVVSSRALASLKRVEVDDVLAHDAPVAHDEDAVAEADRLVDVVRDEQHRCVVTGTKSADEVVHAQTRDCVE